MDLFGRGYSDSPDLPHDSRLYTTQILLAITSSPISWTPGGFNVIGYSLGGGIAVDFAVHFPDMVKGLVLLAPSGLIRNHHFGWRSRVLYSSWVPEAVVLWIVGMYNLDPEYHSPNLEAILS
jgi:pimeloyl-ACP methyl ester carboxylesterase